MKFESTPGVSLRFVHHPKRDGVEPRTEEIFVFDLSKMTLATAFADPRLSDDPISKWTVEQLFALLQNSRRLIVIYNYPQIRILINIDFIKLIRLQ